MFCIVIVWVNFPHCFIESFVRFQKRKWLGQVHWWCVNWLPNNFSACSSSSICFDWLLMRQIDMPPSAWNRHQRERNILDGWMDVTVAKLKTWLGLFMMMGIVQKGCLGEYWSTHWLTQNPGFMLWNHFLQILCYIHFLDNEDKATDKMNKMWKIQNAIGNIKLKPVKWGIKLFTIAKAKSCQLAMQCVWLAGWCTCAEAWQERGSRDHIVITWSRWPGSYSCSSISCVQAFLLHRELHPTKNESQLRFFGALMDGLISGRLFALRSNVNASDGLDTSLEWAKAKKEKKRESLDAQRPTGELLAKSYWPRVTSQDEACGARHSQLERFFMFHQRRRG